jgi:hypothetical protein
VRCLAVSAALLATSWATCLPRSRASCPVSLTRSLTWSATGPNFSSSTRVEGTASPARKPIAAAPMASPSGFSLASPAVRLACCLSWPLSGVASLTRDAVPLTESPARDAVPATASLARVAVSLTLSLTLSTVSLTLSLAREGTSAL